MILRKKLGNKLSLKNGKNGVNLDTHYPISI